MSIICIVSGMILAKKKSLSSLGRGELCMGEGEH